MFIEHEEDELYEVWVSHKSGTTIVKTKKEVYALLDEGPVGRLYRVSSPTMHDTSEFVPF